jgi:hypothetical protein
MGYDIGVFFTVYYTSFDFCIAFHVYPWPCLQTGLKLLEIEQSLTK